MKLVQFIVAAAILIPAASSFAQSTPQALNDDVRTQLVQEKLGYESSSSNAQKQKSPNNINQNESQSRQIAGKNMGRYSLAVVVPSF